MKCEICDTQTATMWVEEPRFKVEFVDGLVEGDAGPVITKRNLPKKVLSCDDCGPQLGYKTLAALEPVKT